MSQIKTPKMSEILKEEFMVPNGITAYRLAADIDVPMSRIQDILHDRRKVTAETSILLGRYFGVSENFFLKLQCDIDLRNAKTAIAKKEKEKAKRETRFLMSVPGLREDLIKAKYSDPSEYTDYDPNEEW